ncbi:hypothetical protein SEA_YAKULT_61 [Gordonia phage Yakult]|nr:hypothetical protein SEA_YAKULT_61 [Gordonia phage Yakult]
MAIRCAKSPPHNMTVMRIPAQLIHGTLMGYRYHHCHCEACRQANTDYCRRQREKRLARGIPKHVHGTANGYGNYGCRCSRCYAAWSAKMKQRTRRDR